tara:strand:- start:5863 stop:6012 length:150 start_codon:yes stop_codon:yes gene_type:complete
LLLAKVSGNKVSGLLRIDIGEQFEVGLWQGDETLGARSSVIMIHEKRRE